ncbi:LytTR family DNA-binding domain-containing protein [Marinicella sp. W31]|uniref:LytTR family DNA-binding domain-containing protein n=1 Tax=Marinicella sp. W31 TaxID=3023713 RepID=UPI0037582A2E
MNLIMTVFLGLFLGLVSAQVAVDQNAGYVNLQENVQVCFNELSSDSSNHDACVSETYWKVNPHKKDLLLHGIFKVPENHPVLKGPAGFFISGKVASEIYLNDQLIGFNGKPGVDATEEIPGQMDASFFVPQGVIQVGDNVLKLRLSGHHGFIELRHPIHVIALDVYQRPQNSILRYYWPSLLPFGVLLIGALYLFLVAVFRRQQWSAYLLPLMSLLAAAQLFVEVYRGIVGYAYPFHDIRLLLILLFSAGFGLSLLAYVITLLPFKNKLRWFVLGCIVMLISVFLAGGFDGKSTMAFLVPVVLSIVMAFYQAIKLQKQAIHLLVVLNVFLIVIFAAPSQFLDVYYFYIVAFLLMYLFVQQAQVFAQQEQQRMVEQARADRLQMIIDQNTEKQDSGQLKVTSVGKIEMIPIHQITFCKGAGDYVELMLKDGSSVLHGGSLNGLEDELPKTFLRVHRSYIVNTAMIESLQRNSSGSGQLLLNNHQSVPVSRRILPLVRKELA